MYKEMGRKKILANVKKLIFSNRGDKLFNWDWLPVFFSPYKIYTVIIIGIYKRAETRM